MIEQNVNVAYVGLSGFPFGLAAISRQKLLCQGLQHAGASVRVLCHRAAFRDDRMQARSGTFEGVPFQYAVNPKRNEHFLIRNILRLIGPWQEFRLLWKLNKQQRITHLLVTNNNEILNSVWYACIAKTLGSKVIFSLVELYEPSSTTSWMKKMNHRLFIRYGLRLYDAYLPISTYIANYFQGVKRPSLLLPIMVDFNKIDALKIEEASSDHAFVFCGSAGYPRTIAFCIQAFEKVHHAGAQLHIVAGGSDAEVQAVLDLIRSSTHASRIVHHMNLTEEDLYKLYKRARALLIPLFNTVQDRARFPHKLGEYLATGKPVITTSSGEIAHYLKHQEQALFAESENTDQFAHWMDYVLNQPLEAERIGREGQRICKEQFDHLNLGHVLFNFMVNNMQKNR